MVEDISRKTLFVLVILTLLISVLGTWTVLSQINAGPSITAPSSPNQQTQTGKVSLNIQPPQESKVAGKVVFNIEPSR